MHTYVCMCVSLYFPDKKLMYFRNYVRTCKCNCPATCTYSNSLLYVAVCITVVHEFGTLLEEKGTVEDFVMWVESIVDKCVRKVCVCVCVYTYVYVYVHVCIRTCMYTYIWSV